MGMARMVVVAKKTLVGATWTNSQSGGRDLAGHL